MCFRPHQFMVGVACCPRFSDEMFTMCWVNSRCCTTKTPSTVKCVVTVPVVTAHAHLQLRLHRWWRFSCATSAIPALEQMWITFLFDCDNGIIWAEMLLKAKKVHFSVKEKTKFYFFRNVENSIAEVAQPKRHQRQFKISSNELKIENNFMIWK